jgi:hypothetical protein
MLKGDAYSAPFKGSGLINRTLQVELFKVPSTIIFLQFHRVVSVDFGDPPLTASNSSSSRNSRQVVPVTSPPKSRVNELSLLLTKSRVNELSLILLMIFSMQPARTIRRWCGDTGATLSLPL